MTPSHPKPPPRRTRRHNRGSGCWLIAFVSIFLSTILLLIGLLLPPFSLSDRLAALQYDPLNRENPELIVSDALTIRLPSDIASDDFALRAGAVSRSDFQSGIDTLPPTLVTAKAALPANLALQSPVYHMASIGSVPDRLEFTFELTDIGVKPELLSLYGWEGEAWRFIPARQLDSSLLGEAEFLPHVLAIFQSLPETPIIMVSQELNHDLNAEVIALATIISPAGLRPAVSGGLVGSLAPGGDAESGYRYLPLIRNFSDPRVTDPATIERLFSDPGLRAEHISQLTDVAVFNGFHGLFIDYRDFSAQYRDDFSHFIRRLGARLHQNGLMLGIVVPAGHSENVDSGAYDWRALGAAVDFFQLDIDIPPSDFAPNAPESVTNLLGRAVNEVERAKLLLGLSARSMRELDSAYSRIGFNQALAALGDVQISADKVSETGSVEPGTPIRASLDGLDAVFRVEEALNLRYLDYFDSGGEARARVWLTDAPALQSRMHHALDFGLAGIAFDDLLSNDLMPGVVDSVRSFRAQVPQDLEPETLAAHWTVEGNAGAVAELITGLSDDFVLTLAAPEGNYAVNLAVIDEAGKSLSQREGAVLPLYNPTATPTPTPTPTRLPTPTPRPVPVFVAPVTSGQPAGAGSAISGNFAAVPPPAGSISIEIGGHVTGAGSSRAIDAMRSAGMIWLKIQARFDWRSPPDMSREINIAHSNGFKILVGTVGRPNELQQGGGSYINSYTDWLARIAGQGADAIEVWNEPNLDREWPRGQISGAAYVPILAAAYQKIKAANGNTLVISAAPAPTGVSDRPDQVMPDNTWLREMVAAGGLDHLDCVGAHYNEGIVSPSQSSGDPRGDNYYTRYFFGMLNGYISITRRPICFTELGYLTAEGYPALSEYFGWADNVTVAQQAAWLAEAAALASQSGQVRLLIVWNVDFTHYGADPQAGYAIVRPDGSCPACATLAQAR